MVKGLGDLPPPRESSTSLQDEIKQFADAMSSAFKSSGYSVEIVDNSVDAKNYETWIKLVHLGATVGAHVRSCLQEHPSTFIFLSYMQFVKACTAPYKCFVSLLRISLSKRRMITDPKS